MKVIVSRTSGTRFRLEPCDEAYEGQVHLYKYRIEPLGYRSPKDCEADRKKLVESGCRDIVKVSDILMRGTDIEPTKVWLVDLNTVEEVAAFLTKYGDCIVREPSCEEGCFDVEIYDYYRE